MGQTETFDSPPRHGTAGFADLFVDIGRRPRAVGLALVLLVMAYLGGPGATAFFARELLLVGLAWVVMDP